MKKTFFLWIFLFFVAHVTGSDVFVDFSQALDSMPHGMKQEKTLTIEEKIELKKKEKPGPEKTVVQFGQKFLKKTGFNPDLEKKQESKKLEEEEPKQEETKKLSIDEQQKLKKEQQSKEEAGKPLPFPVILKKTGVVGDKPVQEKKEETTEEPLIKLKEEKNNSEKHTIEEYKKWKETLVAKDNKLLEAVREIPLQKKENALLIDLSSVGELKKILPISDSLRKKASSGFETTISSKSLQDLNFTDAKHARTAILAFGRVEPLKIEDLIDLWRGWNAINKEDPKGYALITQLFDHMVSIFEYYFDDICNEKSFVVKMGGKSDARADIERVLAFYKTISPFLREANLSNDECVLFNKKDDSGVGEFLKKIETALSRLLELCDDPCIKKGLFKLGLTETQVNRMLKTEKSNRVWCYSGNYVKDNKIENDPAHTPEVHLGNIYFYDSGNMEKYSLENTTSMIPGDPEGLNKKYYYTFNFDVERIEKLAKKIENLKSEKKEKKKEKSLVNTDFLNSINTLVGYALSDSTCPVCFSMSLASGAEKAKDILNKLDKISKVVENIKNAAQVLKSKAILGIEVLKEIIKKERSYSVYLALNALEKVPTNIEQEAKELKVNKKQNPLQELVDSGIKETRLLNGCFWVRRYSKDAQEWLKK